MRDQELFDQTEFKRALKLYESQSSKDFADVVNKAAIDACFIYPRYADAMKLSDLTPYNPLRKRGKSEKTRLFYALEARRGKRRGGGIRAAAEKRYQRRRSSKGYLKLMLLKSAKDLGANVRSKMPTVGSAAARGSATKATQFRLAADIATGFTDDAAVAKIAPAFKSALTVAARNMKTFAEKRMADTARKYSGG